MSRTNSIGQPNAHTYTLFCRLDLFPIYYLLLVMAYI